MSVEIKQIGLDEAIRFSRGLPQLGGPPDLTLNSHRIMPNTTITKSTSDIISITNLQREFPLGIFTLAEKIIKGEINIFEADKAKNPQPK